MIERDDNERLQLRNPRIGIMGAFGSGKTTLAGVLEQHFGFERLEEDYVQNPFLERFYRNPRKFSFKSQLFCLVSKFKQIQKTTAVIIDPDKDMDKIFALTQYQMGWMNKYEYQLYTNAFQTLFLEKVIPEPDMYLVVDAPEDVVIKRIKERGRPYEMWLLESQNRIKYVGRLCENVRKWAWEKQRTANFPPTVFINSASDYFAKDDEEREGLAENVLNWINYHFVDKLAPGVKPPFVVPKLL